VFCSSAITFGPIAGAQPQPPIGFQYFPIPSQGSVPRGITAGPDGALWFTESATNRIGRVTTDGVFTEFLIPTSESTPTNIVSGPDGNIWFTEFDASQIGRITPAGVITEFTVPTPNSGPWGITVGPDGALWFTEYTGQAIGRMDISGKAIEYPLSLQTGPRGIASGPDGNVWFVESDLKQIGRMTTRGVLTEFALSGQDSFSQPESIVAAPDGNLWFTLHPTLGSLDHMGRITPDGLISTYAYAYPSTGNEIADSGPDLAVGPDHALWYPIRSGCGWMGRIAVKTESYQRASLTCRMPTSLLQQSASGVANGPDGALWFTVSYRPDLSSPVLYAIGRASILSLAPTALPIATVGRPYSARLDLSGATPPYQWAAKGLPPGVSLSGDGLLSGTPSAAGANSIQVLMRDSSTTPMTVGLNLTLDVNELVISPTILPTASQRTAFSANLSVSAGIAPYQWSYSPPVGTLQLVAQGNAGDTAILGGASYFPEFTGRVPIVVRVTDSSTPSRSATLTTVLDCLALRFGLMVGSDYNLGVDHPVGFSIGQPFYVYAASAGGTPPYTYSAKGLPPGFTLSSDGLLSGTPTSASDTLQTINVADSSVPPRQAQTLLHFITEKAIRLLVKTSHLPTGMIGRSYSVQLAAEGGVPPYHWTSTQPLPAWLELSDDGRLTGTPSADSQSRLWINVKDSSGIPLSASTTLDVNIFPGPAPSFLTTSPPPGLVGQAYTFLLSALYTSKFEIASGSFPNGLSITGGWQINGTPTRAGIFNFTIQATGPYGLVSTQPMSIEILDSPQVVILSSDAFPFMPPSGTLGTPYSAQLVAVGGTPPYSWTASLIGAPGWRVSQQGVISGIPASPDPVSFFLTVTDSSSPPRSASGSVTIGVLADTVPKVSTTSLLDGKVGTYYSQTLAASGGSPPYTWSDSPAPYSVPAGLTMNAITGTISGTPLVAGTYFPEIHVSDSYRSEGSSFIRMVIDGAEPTNPERIGVFSQVASGSGWTTSLYLFNPSSSPQPITVNFRADGGAPLELPLVVEQHGSKQSTVSSTFSTILVANETVLLRTVPSASTGLTGWAEVLGTNSIAGYGVFHYTSPDGIESEGTVPLDIATSNTVFLPYEASNGFRMGIALANLSGEYPVEPGALIWDEAGLFSQPASVKLPGGGHTSFMLADKMPSSTGHRGFLQFTSSHGPEIAALGLRVNPAGGFTSTPVLTTGSVLPHFAAGAGWKTTLYATNLSTSLTASPVFTFHSDDGTTAAVSVTVTQSGATQNFSAGRVPIDLAPASTAVIEPADSPTSATSGWAEISGAGYGVFHYTSPSGVESEGTLAFDGAPGPAFLLPYDCTGGLSMGVAAVNTHYGLTTTIDITVVDEAGNSLPGSTLILPAHGHIAFTLTDKLPAVTGHRGYLRFTSREGIAVSGIGIRVNPTGGFTSVPKLNY
jgi:streptogramin lyase